MNTTYDTIATMLVVQEENGVDPMVIMAPFHANWSRTNPNLCCYSYTFGQESKTLVSNLKSDVIVTRDQVMIINGDRKGRSIVPHPIPDWKSLLRWIHLRQQTARHTPTARRTVQQYDQNQSIDTDVLHIHIREYSAKLPALASLIRMLNCRVVFFLPSERLQTEDDAKHLSESSLVVFSQLVVTTSPESEKRWLNARFYAERLKLKKSCGPPGGVHVIQRPEWMPDRKEDLTMVDVFQARLRSPRIVARRDLAIDTLPRMRCVKTLNRHIRRVWTGDQLPLCIPSVLILLIVDYDGETLCFCSDCLAQRS